MASLGWRGGAAVGAVGGWLRALCALEGPDSGVWVWVWVWAGGCGQVAREAAGRGQMVAWRGVSVCVLGRRGWLGGCVCVWQVAVQGRAGWGAG